MFALTDINSNFLGQMCIFAYVCTYFMLCMFGDHRPSIVKVSKPARKDSLFADPDKIEETNTGLCPNISSGKTKGSYPAK